MREWVKDLKNEEIDNKAFFKCGLLATVAVTIVTIIICSLTNGVHDYRINKLKEETETKVNFVEETTKSKKRYTGGIYVEPESTTEETTTMPTTKKNKKETTTESTTHYEEETKTTSTTKEPYTFIPFFPFEPTTTSSEDKTEEHTTREHTTREQTTREYDTEEYTTSKNIISDIFTFVTNNG